MMNPLFVGIHAWIDNFGTGDSMDGFWYNNPEASGSQLYPTGLAKYYDLHSTEGLS